MVVDDNRHIRMIVKTILRSLGVERVVDLEDAASALREMRNLPLDLIICDLMMTPIDGIEFVRMVRNAQDSPDRFVPIIMLTGHTEMQRVAEARDAGVHEFLAKPVSADILFERVTTVIGQPRPFVKSKTYFGPDRRRRDDPKYRGPERRVSANSGYFEGDYKRVPHGEMVARIAAFLASAHSIAADDFGATTEQKLYLLGYLGGIVDHWSLEHLHMKVEFKYYLRKALLESGAVAASEINSILSSFAVVSADPRFRQAWTRAREECVLARDAGGGFVPQGLREFGGGAEGLALV